jgi:hypothetical protein
MYSGVSFLVLYYIRSGAQINRSEGCEGFRNA